MRRTVLITGTRAPAAVDLARLFAAAGWRVVGADAPLWPLGRFSRAFAAHYRIPAPRPDHRAFAAALGGLIEREKADLLIPTCEEAFYVARHHAALSRLCCVACSPLETLSALHDKARLSEAVDGLGIDAPETILLERLSDLEHCRQIFGESLVLKPAFSRFGSRTLICPGAAELRRFQTAHSASPREAWVCQRFVEGTEHCTYGVAIGGRLTAFAAYRPVHRVGKGSGIYFLPAEIPEVESFAAAFAARHALDGQFAFDLIRSPGGVWSVIECNPRATSGVHLFLPHDGLPGAFLDPQAPVLHPSADDAAMIGMAMLLIRAPLGLLSRTAPPVLSDWRRARDVVGRAGDRVPALGQFVSLTENLANAAWRRCSPLKTSTADIEWNGELLD